MSNLFINQQAKKGAMTTNATKSKKKNVIKRQTDKTVSCLIHK